MAIKYRTLIISIGLVNLNKNPQIRNISFSMNKREVPILTVDIKIKFFF